MTLGFRKYLELEQLKKNVVEAVDDRRFPNAVLAYLSTALSIDFEKKPWEETVQAFIKDVISYQLDKSIPIIGTSPKKADKKDAWDYENRTWSQYAHIIAQAYGWTLDYIAELDPNEAFALVQEILTDEQLNKEFTHSLSELSYKYNKSSKSSSYVPMKRPYWMRPSYSESPKKIKVKRSLLPVGAGVDLTGLPKEFGVQNYIT